MKKFFLFALLVPALAQAGGSNIGSSGLATAKSISNPIFGTWEMRAVIQGISSTVRETITPTSTVIQAQCAYPSSLPIYAANVTLRLRSQITGPNSGWATSGYAVAKDGPLNCPLRGAGGNFYFRVKGNTLYFMDANGSPLRATDGNVYPFHRVR